MLLRRIAAASSTAPVLLFVLAGARDAAAAVPQGDACGEWGHVTHDSGFLESQVPLAVAELPDGTAWAVGYSGFGETSFATWYFDGAQWSMPFPPSSGGFHAYNSLSAVATEPDGTVWIAGSDSVYTFSPVQGNQTVPFAARRVNGAWQTVPTPQLLNFSASWVSDIGVVGDDDVWFVGGWASPSNCKTGLAMHWNGAHFTVWDTPCVMPDPVVFPTGGHVLSAVEVIEYDDVWAVGAATTAFGGPSGGPGYILHFDGTGWTHYPHAAPGTEHGLVDVAAIASDDVWAIGRYRPTPTAPVQGYAVHWDGSAWTTELLPTLLAGLVAFETGEVYGVGDGVWRRDGAGWTPVVDQPPFDWLNAVTATSACRMLAVGIDGAAVFLAARSQPVDAVVESAPGCRGGLLAGGLAATGAPLLGGAVELTMADGRSGELVAGASVALVAIATAPSPTAPCGLPIAGWGLGGGVGELLLDPATLVLTLPVGGAWAGPGSSNALTLALPHEPALAGLELHLQGLWLGTTSPSALLLTNGLALTLGY